MQRFDTDVLIVGAGPVGLTLANALVLHGVDVELIDAMPETIDRAKAHGLWGRTVEMLDIIGLAEPLMATRQFPVPGGSTYLDGRMVNHTLPRSLHHEPYPYSLFQAQHDTETTLETELTGRGITVQRNTRLLSFEQEPDGATAVVETALDGTFGAYRAVLSGHGDDTDEVDATASETRTVRARWIVGCDGAHSTARKLLGLTMEGETVPNATWQTECSIDFLHPNDLQFAARTPGKPGTILGIYTPFSDKWHLNFIGISDLAGVTDPTIEDLQDIFRRTTGLQDAVLRDAKWINLLSGTNFRLPDHFVVGRVVLAGDAAHTRSALGGTGMNGGVQDALNLAWKLALDVQGLATPSLVATYEEEQRAEAVRLEEYVKAGGGMAGGPGAGGLGGGRGGAGRQGGAAAAASMGVRVPGQGPFGAAALPAPALAKPKATDLRGQLAYAKAKLQRRLEEERTKAKDAISPVLEDLADHLPELVHDQMAIRAMMDVHHRGFSLTRDDRPVTSPPSPAARPTPLRELVTTRQGRAQLADDERRWSYARDLLVDWLSEEHPAFAAHFRKQPVALRAGDYVPDAVCRVGGRGTYLRHAIRGTQATLFLFAGDEPDRTTVERLDAIADAVAPLRDHVRVLFTFPSEGWADRHGHPHDDADVLIDGLFEVRRVLQLEQPEVLYLRPDGYLGLRTTQLHVGQVLDYLGLIYAIASA